jgi:hypothetical protein
VFADICAQWPKIVKACASFLDFTSATFSDKSYRFSDKSIILLSKSYILNLMINRLFY